MNQKADKKEAGLSLGRDAKLILRLSANDFKTKYAKLLKDKVRFSF